MVNKTLDLINGFTRDDIAKEISDTWDKWNEARKGWLDQCEEVRQYIFATDTTTTSNRVNDWGNITTIPKLTQIRDNLHANYMAALFPSKDFFFLEARSREDRSKSVSTTNYLRNKVEDSGFKDTISQLLYDYIDYGNAFSSVEWVKEEFPDAVTGETRKGYVGARAVRIRPEDIVFNPTAVSFQNSPKIIRSLVNVGEIASMVESSPTEGKELMAYALQNALNVRQAISSKGQGIEKDLMRSSLHVDGFGSLQDYFTSGYVEVLTFYGDLYLGQKNQLLKNHIIKVIDRSWVLVMKQDDNWFGRPQIFHCGWRTRQDNLWAMGPLANIVGLQYRLDHLENMKADALDKIAYPIVVTTGPVDDFDLKPNTVINLPSDAKVEFLHPDVSILHVNTEMLTIQQLMEDMAGAPRQALGIRTPGEKTAYEVQTLENNAGRVFQKKASYFEENIVEKDLNGMLETTRRNLDEVDVVRMEDSENALTYLKEIKPSDIAPNGYIKARGAAHFARRANLAQNLTAYIQTVNQDQSIKVHISGFKVAQMLSEYIGLDEMGLVAKDINIREQMESQETAKILQENAAVADTMPSSPEEMALRAMEAEDDE